MPPPPRRDRGAARETSPPPQRPFSCKRRGVRFSARRRGTQPPCSRPVGCACGGQQPRSTRFSTRTNERMPQTGPMRSTALNETCRRAQGARGAPQGRSAFDLRPRACLHGQTPASPEPHRQPQARVVYASQSSPPDAYARASNWDASRDQRRGLSTVRPSSPLHDQCNETNSGNTKTRLAQPKRSGDATQRALAPSPPT